MACQNTGQTSVKFLQVNLPHVYIVCKKVWKFNIQIMLYYKFSITRQKTSFCDNTDYTRSVNSNEVVWSFINNSYKKHSKCPPSAFTHACRRARHWVTAALMISWSILSTTQVTRWDGRCHGFVYGRPFFKFNISITVAWIFTKIGNFVEKVLIFMPLNCNCTK